MIMVYNNTIVITGKGHFVNFLFYQMFIITIIVTFNIVH